MEKRFSFFILAVLTLAAGFIGLSNPASAMTRSRPVTIQESGITFSGRLTASGDAEMFRGRISGPWVKNLAHDLGAEPLAEQVNEDSSEVLEECLFCLQELKNQKNLVLTSCKHVFDQECFKQFEKANRSDSSLACPVCRFQPCNFNLLALKKVSDLHYHAVENLEPIGAQVIDLDSVNDATITTPSQKIISRAEDHLIFSGVGSDQLAYILTRGWTLPDTRQWNGEVKRGLTWYTQVLNADATSLRYSVSYNGAKSICTDPNDPLIGVPSLKEYKRLAKAMGMTRSWFKKPSLAHQLFFKSFIGHDSTFWLSYVDQLGGILTGTFMGKGFNQRNEVIDLMLDDRNAVMCVRRN